MLTLDNKSSLTATSRTLSELPSDELVIDLTDSRVVMQFAECVRNLSSTRRQTIWDHNVQLHHKVISQTKLQQQIDDILLFLIIIFGKEQYPDEEQELISKLKQFIQSKPFKDLKTFIQEKYFPLLRDKFITNNEYFSCMIADFAKTHLQSDHSYVPSIGTSIQAHYTNHSNHSMSQQSHPHPLPTPMQMEMTRSYSSPSPSLQMEALLCAKLEERMTEIVMQKFGELEEKINALTEEVHNIKYALTEEAKQNTTSDLTVSTDDILDEISIIKQDIKKLKDNESKTKKELKKQRKASMDIKDIIGAHTFHIHGKADKLKQQKGSKSRTHSKVGKNQKINHRRSMIPIPSESMKVQQMIKREKLKKWLDDECELGEYYETFLENGLDNLSIMAHVTITDLALLGVGKLAHRVKLMQYIHKLKSEQQARSEDKNNGQEKQEENAAGTEETFL